MEYYYCSNRVAFPLETVVSKIYNFFEESGKNVININDIYKYLNESFNVKSFNRGKLAELLKSKSNVKFNIVKDLYIKYVDSSKINYSIDFSIINKIFVKNKGKMIDIINLLGIDLIKDILVKGIKNYFAILTLFLGEHYDLSCYLDEKNSKLILKYIEQFNEKDLIFLLENDEKLMDSIEEFKIFYGKETRKQKLKAKINELLKDVHVDNQLLNIKYLFSNVISKLLNNQKIYSVKDFKNISLETLEEILDYEIDIVNELKSLQISFIEKLNKEFKFLVQRTNKKDVPNKLWKNYVLILENRAKGFTLEASGEDFGLTRERVRQIENKYLEMFFEFYKNIKNTFRSMLEYDLFIQDKDIRKVFSFNPLLFKYFLLCIEDDNIEYCQETNKFYYNDDYMWYNEILNFRENMPQQIKEIEINKYFSAIDEKLKNRNIFLEESDYRKILLKDYDKIGEVYSKNKLSLAEKYRHIWREYFKEDINIYDEIFLNKFKKIYSKVFNDEKEYSNRAIVSILVRIGILCGRGSYRICDRVFMSENLANEIYAYIVDSGKQVFLTNTLFSIFSKELINEGITNKYFLQGALKQRLDDKLYFKRDYVSLTSGDFNIYSEILQYVKDIKRVVTLEEIKKEFAGITDIVLSTALAQDGILSYWKKFIYIENLNITNEDKKFLEDLLLQLVSDNEIHHSSQLLQYIQLVNEDFLRKYFITEQFALFSLLQYLFAEQFEFKRPYIANKNIVIANQTERIKEFVYSKDTCTIDELLEFVYENQMHIYSILDFVDSLEGYVLKDENTIVLEEETNINKYNVLLVEDLISKEIEDDFIFVEDLKNTMFYPRTVKWTTWLLYSAINKYGENFNVIPSNNQFKHKKRMIAKPIIVKKELNIKNIEELKQYLKNKTQYDEEKMFVYLKSKGLL